MTMRCPYCQNEDTQVKDSRPTDDKSSIRRRRHCPACGGRFTTFERVQLRELTVVKTNGKRVPFDRDKLERSIKVALSKRDFSNDDREQMVNGIVRQLESVGDPEVSSQEIGKRVMKMLRERDHVAFIRYSSVYLNFQEVGEFKEAVEQIDDITP